MIRPLLSTSVLLLAFGLTACGPKPEVKTPAAPATPAAKPAAPATAAAPAAPAAPAADPQFPAPVDLNGFGSEEPAERPDQPTRGVIAFGPNDIQHSNGTHWETYTGTSFKAKRWGRYQVRLTYVLNRGALGMQFRMGDLVVKKSLQPAVAPRRTYLGELYIAQAGDVPFALLTPPTDGSSFRIEEIALIPAREGELPTQAEDGRIVLPAKSAITWSETMRYEPKPEKNCLGFWTTPDDFAEWEFEVQKPGRYKVTVTHGCGGGNHGSEVELKHAGQALKFTTQDTGGFQNWRDVAIGEIEIKSTGKQRVVIDPVNKVKAAVLDVQQIVLTPVS